MAEKVTFKISAAAAAYAGKDATREMKLQAAKGEVDLADSDLTTLLYLLAHDPDQEIKGAAILTLRAMPEERVLTVAADPSTQPRILDMLARLYHGKGEIAETLLSNPSIDERTVEFLKEQKTEAAETETNEVEKPSGKELREIGDDEEVDEESEEFQSKYKLSMKMEIAEKIKVALVGDKEWRTLLIRDSNKLVSTSVIKNPRITEGEILAVAQTTGQNDDVIRIICGNKDWLKNYKIRRALVQNCKTPLQTALRLIVTLTDKDLASLAKNKNIPTVISTQARRILFNKRYKGQ